MTIPLTRTETAIMDLSADAVLAGVRRVSVTHDGRKIGHVEKLETERALRIAISRRVNFMKHGLNRAPAMKNGSLAKIAQAQKQSATKRAKPNSRKGKAAREVAHG